MNRTIFEVSSGGVVFRYRGKSLEVLLINTRAGEVWQLPKGLVEKGESLETAALREVKEETGITARVIKKFDKIDYWFWWTDETGTRRRHHKIVYFFLMEYTGGSTEDHDTEVESAEWFEITTAIEKATYKNERELLKKLKVYLQESL